jgi:hypothetical protein
VSTARGGEPGAFEPGLEHLIGALTASGHPYELAGRDAARAAFSAASQQPTPAGSARSSSAGSSSTWSASTRPALSKPASTRSAWRRRPIRVALPARLAVAIAAVVAVFGGFTAAAAAQALPAPVQRIAYSVLEPLGVPVTQPMPSHRLSTPPRAPSPATGPAASHGGCPCPSASAQSTASGTQHHRKPKPKPKAKAKKPVAKPVLRLVSGRRNDRLIVAAHSGRPGDIVSLAEWTGAAWTTVASAPLGPELRAVFILPVKTTDGHLFLADVLEGAAHALVASNRLWVPHPAATGAKAVQPSPTANPTGAGSTTPTPTPTPTLAASTAPATSPPPTTSPTGTGGATPTPTPDPSASTTAAATSVPTQTPGPSTSSSAEARAYLRDAASPSGSGLNYSDISPHCHHCV